jgi:hypothetical protein
MTVLPCRTTLVPEPPETEPVASVSFAIGDRPSFGRSGASGGGGNPRSTAHGGDDTVQ